MSDRATSTVLIDNQRVRVTRWSFAPGAATGWHVHEHDYVIVPLTDGTLRLVEPDGTRDSELRVGAPYFREAGVEHDVVNANDHDFTFIEIEVRS
jgi:quercetin dioxygenase-like cupin family protein